MQARLIATLLLVAATPLAAQTPIPKTPPKLPSPGVLTDTVIISTFKLANGLTFAPAGPLSMNHSLLGKKPSHFRASKFADFHDVGWVTYPASVPNYTGSNTGGCANGSLRMVVHLQVRAPKVIGNEAPTTNFVMSNVARDTTCMLISG